MSNFSVTIVAALAITTVGLPGATDGIVYAATLSATGGTPGYTWSIPSGQLPPGLTLAATTGEISGTPTATGTFSFTTAVSDSGNPPKAQSQASSIAVTAATQTGGKTWYVRPDGGTRYSVNITTGQCNGQYDASYASTGGTGTNQNCAFNDVRYLWQDGAYTVGSGFPGWGWVISGGDTVIIRGGPWRVGWPNANSALDAGTGKYFGLQGDPYDGGAPPPPSGTSAQHTRILGENYSSCGTQTQLHGGYGVGSVLNLGGASYVDVQCLEITDYAQCTRIGTPAYPSGCSTSAPLSDYADKGIVTNASSSNLLLQDLNIHGLGQDGLFGPIGGPVTMTRVRVGFNGFAGWMFDDGSATPDAPGSVLNASYVTMEWNGCNEEYPIVDAIPAISCHDDSTGGFGDAWSAQGSGSGGQQSNLAMTCDHCIIRYNTKDGFGMNHITFTTLSITNSASYGNMGQQWKWDVAPTGTVTIEDTLAIGNCNRMSAPISGAPATFNTYLGDFCRAAGDIMTGDVADGGGTQIFAGNTIVGYSATMWDMECQTAGTCGSSSVLFRDNLFLGFVDTNGPNAGNNPGVYYTNDSTLTLTHDHNLYYNLRNVPTLGTGEINSNPLLVNEPASPITSESVLDNFNFNLTSASPAKGAGVIIPGLTVDYNGTVRDAPPSIGAYQ